MSGVLLSGIQPTGQIHIGNLLGFIKPFVRLQDNSKFARSIMAIADLHSISVGLERQNQPREKTRQTLALLLSAGVEPGKTIIIQQSRLPEHTELMWILGAAVTVPQLTSVGQFKDKSKAYKSGSIPIGLLTYPLLQAADILAYKSTHVLVGSDQKQHMDIVRDVAESFNHKTASEYFPVPEWVFSDNPKIKSLKEPSKKMSKSDLQEKSRIKLTDPPEVVIAKIKGALTDFNSKITYDPEGRPGISNLVDLYSAFTGLEPEEITEESSKYDTLGFKLELASIINKQLDPIRERYKELICDERKLLSTLREGEDLARPIVRRTVEEVKNIIGLELS